MLVSKGAKEQGNIDSQFKKKRVLNKLHRILIISTNNALLTIEVNTVYNASVGGKKTQAWFCDHQLSLTKIPTRARGLLYFYMTSLHEKVAWISHEQITWLSHGQSCEFTWHKVSWLKRNKKFQILESNIWHFRKAIYWLLHQAYK